MMTEYFATNVLLGQAATSLNYKDFPIKRVWKDTERSWFPRSCDPEDPEAVGRVVSIHPTCGDTFYLRLILKNRAGALSYKDLWTTNGVKHPTFKCACIALNFCESDKQWIDCLEEAVAISVPRAIHQMFANILLHCQPSLRYSVCGRNVQRTMKRKHIASS